VQEELHMSDHYWLSETQIERIRPFFARSHGVPRVDDRRVLSGIFHVLRRGLQWRDAPTEYGPHKTLYNRFIQWSEMGVFDEIFKALSSQEVPKQLQIDATHLKAHRTACSLLKRRCSPDFPHKKNRKRQIFYDKTLYKQRHKIENMLDN
jgi:transposase